MPKRVPQFRPTLDGGRPTGPARRDPTLTVLYGRSTWKKFRKHIRALRVLCEHCKAAGRIEPGQDVHHIQDPRDAPELTYSEENVILLCHACHSRETARSGKRIGK